MKIVKVSLDESYNTEKDVDNKSQARIITNSKYCFHLIIFTILIINFIFQFYQFKKINENYKKSNNEKNTRKNYFLEKLIIKYIKTKNLKLLYNYVELDNLFHDDIRYDGARNCLVEFEFNSSCIYNFLFPKKVIGKTRKLYGGNFSTSYVMIDEFEEIKIAYSFGIGPIDWYISFDKELADRNIDVYMYDHTISKLAYENPKFHFHKIGLARKNNQNVLLKSLYDILKENGHLNEKNMILKVDIEGSEWEAFIDFPEEILKNFRFLLFEFHFTSENLRMYYKILSKFNKYHQIFYVHCVNCGEVIQFGDIRICSALEVSYIIKEGHKFENDDSIYPVKELDTSCDNKKILDFNDNIFKYFDY